MFTLYHIEAGRPVLHAVPVVLLVAAVFAVAYRYYAAFLAAKVAALDDGRPTPAHRLGDGQNYHPTPKWVAFGHHFAAISGAGPLVGPVLALQYGYLPGLVWLVVGVCLAGAVQDMLVLAASVRRDGQSLVSIVRHELGPAASAVAAAATLAIIVIALAGLGFVVVKALGGEEVKLPAGTEVVAAGDPRPVGGNVVEFPPGSAIRFPGADTAVRPEAFRIRYPSADGVGAAAVPAGAAQVVAGSSWGTFTIAATIPIALLVGLWMHKLRPGRVAEASVVGGLLVLAATYVGAYVPGSPLEPFFALSRESAILALMGYGFVAAVLPVWLLLGPRDYLSSMLKVGTIGLLIAGVVVANPPLRAPAVNATFVAGGPTFPGHLFPFVFICVMCGAVSGFHALVASGTTPKLVDKESHVRPIGYGAMLVESAVGVTALIAAAALPPTLYYDINVSLDAAPRWQPQVAAVAARYDPLHAAGAGRVGHLDLGTVEQKVGGEALRGRTGGAVTLAVGMAVVFDDAFRAVGAAGEGLLKYWYHFAVMFEALFILTTIDAGTRIGRFLVQETAGRVWPRFARPDWLPGAVAASGLVTGGWGWLIHTGSVDTVWPMFGIANQSLAVLALAVVTTWLVNGGRGKYAWVTVPPMLFVICTTLTAGALLVTGRFADMVRAGGAKATAGWLNIGLTLFVLSGVLAVVLLAAAKWLAVGLSAKNPGGVSDARGGREPPDRRPGG